MFNKRLIISEDNTEKTEKYSLHFAIKGILSEEFKSERAAGDTEVVDTVVSSLGEA